MIVISDTSPIIALFKLNKLKILKKLFGTLLIPPAVSEELRRYNIILPDYFSIKTPANNTKVKELLNELDIGEAEAICLCREVKADLLLIDEKLGRIAAKREGLKTIGLLGIILIAKEKKLIKSVRKIISNLEKKDNFWMSERLKAYIIDKANE